MVVPLFRRFALPLLVAVIVSSQTAPRLPANSLCVNQGGTGGCFGTITAAINFAGNGDTIHIASAATPYFEHLAIDKSLSLVGDNPATTIIDGSLSGQVIRITSTVTVTLTNLTIRRGQAGLTGSASQDGGGIDDIGASLTLNNSLVTDNATGGSGAFGGFGGGIADIGGTLVLNDTTVSSNTTGMAPDLAGFGGFGAGIYILEGNATLTHSTVRGNLAAAGTSGGSQGGIGGFGGGLYLESAVLTMTQSTVGGNLAGDGGAGTAHGGLGGIGGGIYSSDSTATLWSSTVSGNQSGAGGPGSTSGDSGSGAGLYVTGSLGQGRTFVISDSTLSGNATDRGLPSGSHGDGGAIYVDNSNVVKLLNTTLAHNKADTLQLGGAIANHGGTFNLKNSLFADNRDGPSTAFLSDCSGTVNSEGYNVMKAPDCTITATTGDQFFPAGALVGALQNNGGPTLTDALLPGSLAIDAADNSTCSPTDQRGFARPAFGGVALRCDVGAFELYRFAARLPIAIR